MQRHTACVPRPDWAARIAGGIVMIAGVALTATMLGALIGIPLLLGGVGMIAAPPTLRGTPCAP
ncbi:MAG: hypothetical protein ACE5MI_11760 [Acidimicrobiia bacterium]